MAGELGEVVHRIIEWINLGALLLLSGAVIFLGTVWTRAEVSSTTGTSAVDRRFARRWKRFVAGAWLAAAGASVASLVLRPDARPYDLLELGMLGVLAGLALSSTTLRRGAGPTLLAGLVVLGLLLRAALAGHAKASSPLVPNVLAALVHVTAAAVWLGGLAVLIAVAFPALKEAHEVERVKVMARVVSRFSDLAVVAVFAIVVSGTYAAWVEIRTLGALTGSAYGLVFLAKIGTFVPVLALGAINNRWTKPRILRAAREHEHRGERPLLVLYRLMGLEVVLIAVVLGLTAFLMGLSPPAQNPSG
ncbi:MAG: copper resistance D family protein [Actinomycetota bacterium]